MESLKSKNCTSKQIDRLPTLLTHLFMKNAYPPISVNKHKNKYIIIQTDPTTDVYYLHKGKVEVSYLSLNASETIYRELTEGEVFGELSAIDGRSRSVNVEALSACELYQMPRNTFLNLMKTDSQFATWIQMNLVARIRDLTEKVTELSTLKVAPRVWREIIKLAQETGIENDTATFTTFPSNKKLAARLGAGREAVNRELNQLAKDNVIQKSGHGNLTVNSISRLQDMLNRIAE